MTSGCKALMSFVGMFQLLVVLTCFFVCAVAHASVPEVREVARLYGCTPKKIEVIETNIGAPSQTVYRVLCTMPKTVGEGNAPKAEGVLVRCSAGLCDLFGTVSAKE